MAGRQPRQTSPAVWPGHPSVLPLGGARPGRVYSCGEREGAVRARRGKEGDGERRLRGVSVLTAVRGSPAPGLGWRVQGLPRSVMGVGVTVPGWGGGAGVGGSPAGLAGTGVTGSPVWVMGTGGTGSLLEWRTQGLLVPGALLSPAHQVKRALARAAPAAHPVSVGALVPFAAASGCLFQAVK